MAGNIKGITIELDGNSTKLTKAIDGVKRESISLQSELKEVDKLLKFSPGNTDLIAQKQANLAKQIDATSQKLTVLKQAQQQVEAQFKAGTLPEEKYNAFQREVINTEMALKNYKVQLETVNATQKELQSKTQQLETLFKATGTSVDQYADTIGVNLLQAIKTGTASSRQLDTAIEKIGKQALGSSIDVDKMKNALKSVDDGASIKSVKQDLANVSKEAEQAGDKVNGFGEDLKGVVAGLAAGGGIAGVVSKALDTSSLNTKIDISMDVPEESVQSVRNAISTIQTYGVDGEAALQGVQRQWALNKDASDSANAAIVQQAGVIASAYSEIDFNELIQESYEMGKSMGISQKEALGLTNHLLKLGFPAEQLDIISEYGTQLKNAGYNAQEIQAIMAAGVETGTWNIDNLLDGIKEGRIRLAEFGKDVPKSTKALLDGTNISSKQLQKWGQDVAKGGKTGSQAMTEVAKALVGVKDETTRNALGVAIFGTMYEDQGKNITDTLLNASKNTTDLKKNQDDLNDSVKKLDADPAVQMKKAMSDIQTALTPLLTGIAELVGKIAEWVSNNSTLAAVIAAVVTAIGLIVAGFMALAPVFTVIQTLMAGLGVAFSAIAAPIAIAIAAIVALVAAGIALWKNWDSVKSFLVNTWNAIATTATTVFSAIGSFLSNVWNSVSSTVSSVWGTIKAYLSGVWNGIKSVATSVWGAITSAIGTIVGSLVTVVMQYYNNMKSGITSIMNGVKSVLSGIWTAIKNVFLGAVLLIFDLVTGNFKKLKSDSQGIMNNLKGAMTTIWNGIKSIVTGVASAIKGYVTTTWNNIKSVTSSVWNGIKSLISNVWNGIKSTTSTILNGIKSVISNIFGGFKSVVSSAMNGVKSAIVTGWNAAKSFLSGINLTTIGKNIIQGLINGIGSMARAVANKVKSIADSVTSTIRKVLDIHSPSRETYKLGGYTGQGFANGIASKKKEAEKRAKELASAAKKGFNDGIKNLDLKLSAGSISTENYSKQMKALGNKYKSVTNAQATVNARIAKANKKQEQEEQKAREAAYKKRFAKDKTYYSNKSKLDSTSMQAELNILNTLSKKYKKGTDERIYFEQLAKQKKEEITKAKAKIDEDYLSKVQELNQKYIDEEKKLTEEYTKAVDDRAKSLYDFAGLFDQVNTNSEVSGQQLLDNLKGQVTTFEEWQQSIANLKNRGVSDGLISELQQMGPKSAAEVAALNTLTDEQLTEYQGLWKTKSNLARTEAVSELEGMRIDTANQIVALKNETATKLVEYQTEWKNSMSKVTKVTKNEMKNMPSIGSYAVQGLIDGMNAKKSELAAVAAEIASLVASTTQSELDIHSPSRVMKKLGEYTNEGFIVGLQDSFTRLKSAMSNMYGSLANSAQTMMSVGSSTVTSSTNSYDYSKNPSYTVQVTSASDAQIARVVRREFEAMAFKG